MSDSREKDFFTYGPVHLEVTDGEKSVRFWRDILGLTLRKEGGEIELGTSERTLVVLHPVARRPFMQGHSGLYHLAIHMPTEPEFARVLARLISKNYPIAPTDHIMSKSIYMEDPDGITVEITLETINRFGSYDITEENFRVIDSEGRERGMTEALDVREVLATLSDNDLDKPFPPDTYIGHVHLYVGDLKAAYEFYQNLGFLPNLFTPFGFADLKAGGIFPHRLAVNTWQGVGAPPAPEGTAGLKHFILNFKSADFLKNALAGMPEAKKTDKGHIVTDPSGNNILLVAEEKDISAS